MFQSFSFYFEHLFPFLKLSSAHPPGAQCGVVFSCGEHAHLSPGPGPFASDGITLLVGAGTLCLSPLNMGLAL